jgi:hypothetical protein
MQKKTLLIFATSLLVSVAFAQDDSALDESNALARSAVRCSIIYGMGSGAERDEQKKSRLLNIQRSLMLVAPKLGATRPMMEEWLSEFDKDFQSAIGNEKDKVTDPSFIPKQAEMCEKFLAENRLKFHALMAK